MVADDGSQKYKKGLSLNLIIKLGIKEFIGPEKEKKEESSKTVNGSEKEINPSVNSTHIAHKAGHSVKALKKLFY